MPHCLYFQARIQKEKCWMFVAIMRSYEHVCFDRTRDVTTSTFEFFVPEDQRAYFLIIMERMVQLQLVSHLVELPNRLALPGAYL